MIKGVFQYEEYLQVTLQQGKDLLIPCKSKKDADSKRVSLYNARKKLPPADQAKILLQRVQYEGIWGVKISRREEVPVFELPKDFEDTKNVKDTQLSEELLLDRQNKAELRKILEEGISPKTATKILLAKGESKEAIELEIKRLKGEDYERDS